MMLLRIKLDVMLKNSSLSDVDKYHVQFFLCGLSSWAAMVIF